MTHMANKANFILRRRKELELSQEELTARLQTEGCNVSRSTLSNWENSKFQPPLHDKTFRSALARALKMSVRELLQSAEYEIVESAHTEEAQRAAYIIDQLPQDKRVIALGILEHLLTNN